MFEFDLIQCGLIVLFLMTAGEWLSHKMKATIPAILASSILFIALTWSKILPSTIIEYSGLLHISSIAMMVTILGMGISTNPKELMENWRVVALAAISYIGQTCILMLVIGALFDRNTAIAGLPGGAAVAMIIRERASALHLEQVIVLSVLLLSVKNLVACPLASWMLRREIVSFQKEKRNHPFVPEEKGSDTTIPNISANNQSPYWSLLRLFLAAWMAARLELYTGISRYVFCLFLGVLLSAVKFFPKDEMARSKSQGMFTLMMMASILNGYANATPAMLISLIKPLVCVLLVDIISIFLITTLVGRLLKFSKPLSFAIGLNVMIGFPLNLMLAQDLIEFMANSPEEKEILNQQLATKMVIAGFTSVTFLSTVGAGILVTLLK